MARPIKTDAQRAAMRQLILESTTQVIKDLNIAPGDSEGYQQVTIRKVSAKAGISVGTFYSYFNSREDLVRALWAEPVEDLRHEMKQAYDKAKTPTDKIRALLNHYVGFAIGNPRLFRAAFLFVRGDTCRKSDSVQLHDELFYQCMTQAYEQGQRSGEFKPFDGHKMAQMHWASIHGVLALPINLDRYEFDDPKQLAKQMIDLLVKQISA